MAQINESVDKESVSETLESLQMPQAQLKNVEDDNAVLYQLELKAAKTAKAEVSLSSVIFESTMSIRLCVLVYEYICIRVINKRSGVGNKVRHQG